MEKPGIVLAPYGSLYPQALATYEQIREAYEREFPGSRVQLAFTSRLMIKRLSEKEGISIPSPLAALAELHEMGCHSAVIQSLQIVPGEEFHELAKLVQALGIGGKLGFDASWRSACLFYRAWKTAKKSLPSCLLFGSIWHRWPPRGGAL